MYLQTYTKIMRKINASLLSLIERSGKHPIIEGLCVGAVLHYRRLEKKYKSFAVFQILYGISGIDFSVCQ